MKIYDYNGKENICGDRVHEARCKHRLTQSDLAAKLQIAGILYSVFVIFILSNYYIIDV